MHYERFVVLGDSCAEGLDDPYPDGSGYRGWADLVARRLAQHEPGFRYANLAVRGRRLDQIIVEQIPTARQMRPDLVALFGGVNDVLTRASDAQLAERVHRAVRLLSEIAPTVLVFVVGDITRRVPMATAARSRLRALNDAVWSAAVAHGAWVVDLENLPGDTDPRYFGADRLHLSQLGHRVLAAHVLDALGLPGHDEWLAPLPGRPPRSNPLADTAWLWRQVIPVLISRARNMIVGRSPGDGFLPKRPDLLPVGQGELGFGPTAQAAR